MEMFRTNEGVLGNISIDVSKVNIVKGVLLYKSKSKR